MSAHSDIQAFIDVSLHFPDSADIPHFIAVFHKNQVASTRIYVVLTFFRYFLDKSG